MALKIKHKVQERLQELSDMKLIATLGDTKSEFSHTYMFGSELYKERVSFMAVAKKYAIAEQNITILGTAQTEKYIQRAFPNNHFNMVVVDDIDIDELFNKSVEHIDKNTILDLTQGFRHFPMTLLLGAIFDISKEKNIHEIYYNAHEFQKNFKKIDILRNKAAHAFTSDKHVGDMKDDMQQYLLFFQNYFK